MKRTLSMLLICMMLVASQGTASSIATSAELYPGVDLSQPEEITMYHTGNDLADWEKVKTRVNELLKEKINTTVNFVHISFADFIQNYTLYCTSTDIDILYTANFVNYADNARAGAYKEITEEFLSTYMPQTLANMAPAAWNEVKVGGKIWTVPRNYSEIGIPAIVVTSQTLLDKYSFEANEMKNWEDLKSFLYAVAEGEKDTGMYAINCQGFWPSHQYYMLGKYNLASIGSSNNGIWYMWDAKNETFSVDDIEWFGNTEAFKAWALEMAEYYQKGVYPSNVIANESTLDDTFAAGTSAINFGEPSKIIALLNSNPDLVPLFLTANDSYRTTRGTYMRYGNSFPIGSTKTERAAVALDMMLNDPEINMLLVYGFEGDHYILNDDGTYSLGPHAEAYATDTNIFSMQNNRNPILKIDNEAISAWRDKAYAQINENFTAAGFNYDSSKYEAEVAVINSLWNQYQWSLCFGLYGDATESIVDQFIMEAKAAGIDKIEEDFKQQLSAYLGI